MFNKCDFRFDQIYNVLVSAPSISFEATRLSVCAKYSICLFFPNILTLSFLKNLPTSETGWLPTYVERLLLFCYCTTCSDGVRNTIKTSCRQGERGTINLFTRQTTTVVKNTTCNRSVKKIVVNCVIKSTKRHISVSITTHGMHRAIRHQHHPTIITSILSTTFSTNAPLPRLFSTDSCGSLQLGIRLTWIIPSGKIPSFVRYQKRYARSGWCAWSSVGPEKISKSYLKTDTPLKPNTLYH